MKKTVIIISTLILMLTSTEVFSQDQLKIGHVNVVEIITVLPESDSAQLLLEKDSKELDLMLENMQVELNNLVNDFDNNQKTFSELIRKTKESEILEMRDKIYNFQQNAQQRLQQRNFELLQPIYEKIQNAINEVATREGFTYILDISKGSVVFIANDSKDISETILKELGVDQ